MPISEPSPTVQPCSIDLVAHGHVLAQRQREADVGVQHAAVLHVAARAERDRLVVAAQHGAEPDAGAVGQLDAADHLALSATQALGAMRGASSPSW